MASLQEQLLKKGIVDKQKAKQIQKEKYKKARQTPKGQTLKNEAKEQVEKAQAAKLARDREINLQKEESKKIKAYAAQIRQLIGTNRIDHKDGEIAYQFTHDNKIKKIYVTPEQQTQLSKGIIAITILNEKYELVPAIVADKIRQRDENIILLQNQADDGESDADDPYADYKIPDDLTW